jgi:hypothetical protein
MILEMNSIPKKLSQIRQRSIFFLGTEIRVVNRPSMSSFLLKKYQDLNFSLLNKEIKIYAPLKKLMIKLKCMGFVKDLKISVQLKSKLSKYSRKQDFDIYKAKLKLVPCGKTD